MGSLVNQAQTAFDTWKSSKDVTTMNESELSAYNVTVLKFQKAIEDATAIETAFYAARSEAFEALDANYQSTRSALQTTWQGYEDNNFTVA